MSDLRRIVWLASYPKSGNTWARMLLAHYFLPPGEAPDINNLRKFTTADVRQDFFDRAAGRAFVARDVGEWLRMRPKALRLIAGSKPGHHFVKTHCQVLQLEGIDLIPPEVTAAAIYLMRNPFDLAPSFARHQGVDIDTAIGRLTHPETLMATPSNLVEVLGRWDDHVRGWTEAPGLPRHVMRYEDLLASPEKAFRGLLRFLKAPVKDGPLRRAVRATSFDALRRQEDEKGFIERPPQMDRFFARGEAGAWREDLTPGQVARLREAFLPMLERWYPEMLEETAEAARA